MKRGVCDVSLLLCVSPENRLEVANACFLCGNPGAVGVLTVCTRMHLCVSRHLHILDVSEATRDVTLLE